MRREPWIELLAVVLLLLTIALAVWAQPDFLEMHAGP
jgi:hypothetical protein